MLKRSAKTTVTELRQRRKHGTLTPIVLHENVGQYVAVLERNDLRLLIKVGERICRAGNSTTTDRRGVKWAHTLINRRTLCEACGFTEKDWDGAVNNLEKWDLMRVSRGKFEDRYLIMRPSIQPGKLKKLRYYTRNTIPRMWRKK